MNSIELPPSHDLLDLAEQSLAEGRPEATLELARQVLSARPDHVGAMFLEAEALRDLRERDEAIAGYRRLLARDPENASAWAGLGHVHFEEGDLEDASKAIARALRLDPAHADALWCRSLLRERRGDAHGARRDQLRAWHLSPRYPLPRTIDDEELRALLADAAEGLDEGVQAWLESTPVLVTDLPDLATCRAYDPFASPAELLGHVAARLPSDVDAGTGAWNALPPAVMVFRRNLERFADDREHLVEALREGVLSQVSEAMGAAAFSE